MKKTIALLLTLVLCMTLLCSCGFINNEKNSIDKNTNTAISIYKALEQNFVARKLTGYNLYGAVISVSSDNVGKYTYFYTDKAPENIKYSDILAVEINNRNGRIEKFGAVKESDYGTLALDMVKTATVLNMSEFKIDSDVAIRTAVREHFDNDFVFNFIKTTILAQNGVPVYQIEHISLVNDCVYKTVVNANTGAVITKSVEELE